MDGWGPARTGVGAAVIGGAAGGALICLALAAAHDMTRGPDTPFANVALAAAGAGLLVAALASGILARRLGGWRAAASSMVAIAGAALVAALTTAADAAAGTLGLLLLALLCAAAAAFAWRGAFAPCATGAAPGTTTREHG